MTLLSYLGDHIGAGISIALAVLIAAVLLWLWLRGKRAGNRVCFAQAVSRANSIWEYRRYCILTHGNRYPRRVAAWRWLRRLVFEWLGVGSGS